jgi:hypothetical protein
MLECASTAYKKPLFSGPLSKAAAHRLGVDDLHALDISVTARAFLFAEDIKWSIIGDFDRDPRLAKIAAPLLHNDILFELADCLTAGLDIADQPIRDPARAADFKNTGQIGLATKRYFHSIAGSERIDIPHRLVPIGVIRFRCTGRHKKDDGDHNVESNVVPPSHQYVSSCDAGNMVTDSA